MGSQGVVLFWLGGVVLFWYTPTTHQGAWGLSPSIEPRRYQFEWHLGAHLSYLNPYNSSRCVAGQVRPLKKISGPRDPAAGIEPGAGARRRRRARCLLGLGGSVAMGIWAWGIPIL